MDTEKRSKLGPTESLSDRTPLKFTLKENSAGRTISRSGYLTYKWDYYQENPLIKL